MIGKAIGALFGAEMARGRGGSGVTGAAVGAIATAVIRRMGPVGWLIGGAYVAKKAYDRHHAGEPIIPEPADRRRRRR